MFARITCLLAAAFLPGAAGPPEPPAGKGPAELQGAWELVTVEFNGESNDYSDAPPRLVIRGDRAVYGGQEVARLTADPAATPKVIDLHFAKPERVLEGVYAAEGDALKICVSTRTDGARERPQDFATKDREDRRLLVFRRAAEGATENLRGFAGVAIGRAEGGAGVAVVDVLDGGPAKAAGLRKDDVILRVGSQDVNDIHSAVEAVRQAKPGGELTVRVRRSGEERDVTIKVGLVPFTVLALLN
jgi:uncharacterized protein (TIGR03067 family)